MTFYGIKISKPGKSVLSDNKKDFIFNSDDDIVKVIKSGTVELTISSGTGTVGVHHGLGYCPTFMVYYAAANYYLIDYPNAFSENYGRESSNVVIGGSINKVNLNIYGRGTDGTYEVYYEIFEQGGYR